MSAFTNLEVDSKADIIPVMGKEKIFANYPEIQPLPEIQADLIKMMLKAQVDTDKCVIYGHMFLKGTINRKKLFTPLFFSTAKLDRTGSMVSVILDSEVHLNLGALMNLVEDVEAVEVITNMLTDSISVTEDTLAILENTFENLDVFGKKPNAPIKVDRDKAVILTKPPKDIVGLVRDLTYIQQTDDSATALSVISNTYSFGEYVEDPVREVLQYSQTKPLDKSQREAVETALNSDMTAILGGPGTGKSTVISNIASSYLLNGKSVLIASKLDNAVDVVADRLNFSMYFTSFKGVMRTGNKEHRQELANHITEYAHGLIYPTQHIKTNNAVETLQAFNKDKEQLLEAETILDELYRNYVDTPRKGFVNSVKSHMAQAKSNKQLAYVNKLREKMNAYSDEDTLGLYALREYMYKKYLSERDNLVLRQKLLSVAKMMKTGHTTNMDYNNHFRTLLNVFPCWATTTNYVSDSIPCIAGLFDLVIIDEASQCDIASCLPLLFRAKRAVIVGDNNQLKFISFMRNTANTSFKAKNQLKVSYYDVLDYRENSMYDFAQFFTTARPCILKENYRSYGAIFNFSSTKFYGGSISSRRNVPNDKLRDTLTPVLGLVKLSGGKINSTKQGNIVEAKAIISKIREIIDSQAQDMSERKTSIGVVSPFRGQVELIQDMISKQFTSEEIKRHGIKVGTAHTFQGDEKDVMLISWVVTPTSPRQNHTFINNKNLFNVAITRACNSCISYTSVDIEDIPNGLLKEYLEYIKSRGIEIDMT
jgi:superfamily I DNA and/or RNA helicase